MANICNSSLCKITGLFRLRGLPNRTPTLIIDRNSSFNFWKTLITSSSAIMERENGSVESKVTGVSGSAATGGGGRVLGTYDGGGGDERRIVQYVLTASSSLKIQKGDITKWFVDGASDAILYIELLVQNFELRALMFQRFVLVSDAPWEKQGLPRRAFRLPVSHVIHTVGPIYDADEHAEASLRSAYRNCLRLAKESNIQYIAFPAVSCGVYRYPYEEAATIAISTVKEFAEDLKEVHFVLFLDELYNVWLEKANELL